MSSEEQTITLNLALKIPLKQSTDLTKWLFEYFTNMKVTNLKKINETIYTCEGITQPQLISIPQILDDSAKLSEGIKELQQELISAEKLAATYKEASENSEKEADSLQEQIISQSFIIEKLANENTEYINRREIRDENLDKLLDTMKNEKEELIAQGKKLTEKFKDLQKQNEESKPTENTEKANK